MCSRKDGRKLVGRSAETICIEEPFLDYDRLTSLKPTFYTISSPEIIVDLSHVARMTTAAFAQLVTIKAALHRGGHNLHVTGLQGQPQALCDLLKLAGIVRS